METKPRSDARGFALLIVLWSLVLLALIVAEIGTSGRVETKIARNLMANAQAEAAADGAVFQAIFAMSNSSDSTDGNPHQLIIGTLRVDVQVDDEAGKANPNIAPPDLLQALLVVLGADRTQAQAIAEAIVEWRGHAPPERQAAIGQRYRAAGLRYRPTFSPFESIEDVALVLGMPPELAARLLPHLSVHQVGMPDPSKADPIVARAYRQLSAGSAVASPAQLAYRNVTITAVAHGPNGALFTRRALARLGPGLPQGYVLVTWEAPGATGRL
jgi:general secretion pathway protein K